MNNLLLILLAGLLVVLCLLVLSLIHENRKTRLELALHDQDHSSQLKQNSQSFQNILAQMQSLNRTQSQDAQSLDWILEQVDALARTMNRTKARGSWGEYQLEAILANLAGHNTQVYSMQYTLDNGRIADAAFHLPQSGKVLCIDSKFPMENFLRMEDQPEQAAFYQREFKKNMKKHIDDVADKYITPQTSRQAILFIPSEGIYEYVCSQLPDLFQYALNRHVLLASPTTLAGIVFNLVGSHRDFYRAENLEQIEKQLNALQEDLNRLEARFDKAAKSMDAAQNSMALVRVSIQAVQTKYEKLLNGSQKENL